MILRYGHFTAQPIQMFAVVLTAIDVVVSRSQMEPASRLTAETP